MITLILLCSIHPPPRHLVMDLLIYFLNFPFLYVLFVIWGFCWLYFFNFALFWRYCNTRLMRVLNAASS